MSDGGGHRTNLGFRTCQRPKGPNDTVYVHASQRRVVGFQVPIVMVPSRIGFMH